MLATLRLAFFKATTLILCKVGPYGTDSGEFDGAKTMIVRV